MKKNAFILILFSIFYFSGISGFSAEERYSINFTDVRYNKQQKKFYFLEWDELRDGEERNLERYVRGDFKGRFLEKITKYYKKVIQIEMFLNTSGVCIKKRDFINGQISFELHYNSNGFIPDSANYVNVIKKIEYKNNIPSRVKIYDGNGKMLSVTNIGG